MTYYSVKFFLLLYYFQIYNVNLRTVKAECLGDGNSTACAATSAPVLETTVNLVSSTEKPRSVDLVQQKVSEIVKNPVNVDLKKLPIEVIEKIAEGGVTMKPSPKSTEEISTTEKVKDRTEMTTPGVDAITREMLIVYPEENNKTREEKIMKVDVFFVYPEKVIPEKYDQRNKREEEPLKRRIMEQSTRSHIDRKKLKPEITTEEPKNVSSEPTSKPNRFQDYRMKLKRPTSLKPIVVPPTGLRVKMPPRIHSSDEAYKKLMKKPNFERASSKKPSLERVSSTPEPEKNVTNEESTTKSKSYRRPPSFKRKPEVSTVKIPTTRRPLPYKFHRRPLPPIHSRKLKDEVEEIAGNGDIGEENVKVVKNSDVLSKSEDEDIVEFGDSMFFSQIQPLSKERTDSV